MLPRESIFCDVSKALAISSILLLIFLSTYPLQDVRKMEDPFRFVSRVHVVAGMAISRNCQAMA
jgi:hypothetical protein